MKKIGLILSIALLLSTAACALAGCTPTDERQVPIYTGMNISSSVLLHDAPNLSQGGDIFEGNEGNHYGQIKGDHTERDDEINPDFPFPDNGAEENIESEMKPSLEVFGSVETIYYTSPGEDIYINIQIDNPDSFEIVSFTLNGKKYSSYMFEEGSDMENIIIKYNVGDATGIVAYTIDAIKYVDGTEIKDVKIGGKQTVLAGIRTDNQVSVDISSLTADTDRISFTATVEDNDRLLLAAGGIVRAVLYDGRSIISVRDLTVGTNEVVFDGLSQGTLYQFAIGGYYDDLTGHGPAIHMLAKDTLYTDSMVLFDNLSVGFDSLSFGFKWNEKHPGGELLSLKLYISDSFVCDVAQNAGIVSGLFSDTDYRLVGEYQNGENVESISIEFTTARRSVPKISLGEPSVSPDSIGFTVSEDDKDGVGNIDKIELIHKNGATVAESADVRAFYGLLSNNEYTVRISYSYDLGDGGGRKNIVKELAVKTNAKSTPSLTVKGDAVTDTSIAAELEIDDADGVISSYKVELYSDGELLFDAPDKKISFSSLGAFTDYTLKITYVYDLGDGEGEHTAVLVREYKTLPYLDLTELKVTDEGALCFGDVLHLEASLENPLSLTVCAVVINGKQYSVTADSTPEKIHVEIPIDDSFGGQTSLAADSIILAVGDSRISAYPKTALTCAVFINGRITPLSIEIVGEDLKSVDWALKSNALYALLTLDNPTDYDIDSITVNGRTLCGLTRLDGKRWYCDISDVRFGGWLTLYLSGVSYSNEYIERSESFNLSSAAVMSLDSDDVHYVSSADELLSMNENLYYELTGDVDLSGRAWSGGSFSGYLNGNGYSIKNMTYAGTVSYTNAYIGLFANASGIINDLHIEDASVLVTVNGEANTYLDAYIGGFAAISNGLRLIDCTVDEYSSFSVKTSGSAYVGGLIGKANGYTAITDADFGGSVLSDGASLSYAGGLVAYGNALNIGGSSVSGSISAKNDCFAGGIIGYCDSITVTDSENAAAVSATAGELATEMLGGFVGSANDVILENAKNSGAISAQSGAYIYVGGLVGRSESVDAKNSQNLGAVNATGAVKSAYSGGLVGISDTILAAECHNGGGVTVSAAQYAMSGGIIGYAKSAALCACRNTATVSAESEERSLAAGIVGFALTEAALTDSYNDGKITSSSEADAASAGGLIAYADKSTALGSHNAGEIFSTGHAGGIICDVLNETEIRDCYNSGNISAEAFGGTLSVGGIIGSAGGSVSLYSSYNSGEISVLNKFKSGSYFGSTRAGGAIGECRSFTVSDFINRGKISAVSEGNYETCAGGIISYAWGGVSFLIEGSHNEGEISATEYAGGIVGYVNTARIENSYNTADVTVTNDGRNALGAGIAAKALELSVKSSYNSGKITANSDNTRSCAAGIVASVDIGDISSCYNLGEICAIGSTETSGGGIAAETTQSQEITITDSYNAAAVSVTAKQGFAYVGGIVGNVASISLTGVRNEGAISVFGNSSVFAGGLIGKCSNPLISDCYNTANVSASATSFYSSAGGLVGSTKYASLLSVTDSYNSGAISAKGHSSVYSAGLVADAEQMNSGSALVEDCTNYGKISIDVELSSGYLGGIVGSGENGSLKITVRSSENHGELIAKGNASQIKVGGIIAASDALEITKCHNSGKISVGCDSFAYVGGIAGMVKKASITLCYNVADVTLEGSGFTYCAGIVGLAQYSSLSISSSYNSGRITVLGGDFAYATGILGGINLPEEKTFITSVFNAGKISVGEESSASALASGIVGFIDGVIDLQRCYTLYAYNEGYGTSTSKTELGTKDFYSEVLGWSEDEWDLSSINTLTENYPTLK